MQKSLFSLVLVIGGAAFQVCAPPAQAAPAKKPATETPAQRAGRVAVGAVYTKIDKATATGKFAAAASYAASYFAPDYTERSLNGRVRSRAQVLAAMRQPLDASFHLSFMSRSQTFTWLDKDVKNLVVTNKSAVVGKVGTGARAVPVRLVRSSRDSWTKTPGGWKIFQTVKTGEKAWANGKQVR